MSTSDNGPNKPTVLPANNFDPKQDAKILRKATRGLITLKKPIISIIANRTNIQRQEIAKQFQILYKKKLVKKLKSKTNGKFRDLLVALMKPLPKFYAKEIHDVLNGIGANETTLIEVICSSNNSEINSIKEAYKSKYNKDLEDDITSDTPTPLKRLLASLCQGQRDESSDIDQTAARADAENLLNEKFGTDESTLNTILCTRSYVQLQAIFSEYKNLAGHSIKNTIEKEFSGDIKNSMLAIIKVIRNRSSFFAKRLRESMTNISIIDKTLIRIVVTRCEIDLEDIKVKFNSKYKESLESYIKNAYIDGSYRRLLLALLGKQQKIMRRYSSIEDGDGDGMDELQESQKQHRHRHPHKHSHNHDHNHHHNHHNHHHHDHNHNHNHHNHDHNHNHHHHDHSHHGHNHHSDNHHSGSHDHASHSHDYSSHSHDNSSHDYGSHSYDFGSHH